MIDFSQIVAQFLSGLSYSSTLFLVSSGLSIIFGVTRIVNFAHGSYYMLGAYLAYTITTRLPATPVGFWGGIIAAALIAGAIGIVMEVLILRRIYRAPELFQILATFGVVLIVQNAIQIVWGTDELFASRAPGLKGVVEIAGQPFPQYDLALIALGPAILGLIWLLLHRTRWGILIRAATQDREMAASLGINQSVLFTSVVFFGCFLAGLAGAVQIPKDTANLQMDLHIIIETFVVVVIGGMGSVLGAFVAAIVIGQTHAFGILIYPSLTMVITFVLMAIVLVVRPLGFFGKPERAPRSSILVIDGIAGRPSPQTLAVVAIALAILSALPFVANAYAQIIVTEIFILSVLAASLHLLMSVGGMVSFGHAAYFGIGAFAAALLATRLGAPVAVIIPAAVIVTAVAGAIIGWFSTRLTGVYLAMLTLAFAQIIWSVSVQWITLTGGDNGILGIRPAEWMSSPRLFYYFAFAVALLALGAIRRIVMSPFGYALRAGRDSPLRADATGLNVRRHQWMAFVVSGSFAGLAGALIALQRGRVFPNDLSVATSVDSLVMVLLGGIQALSGPVVGAGAYHLLRTELVRNYEDHWRLILGVVIVILVVAFPNGIVGSLKALWRRRANAGEVA